MDWNAVVLPIAMEPVSLYATQGPLGRRNVIARDPNCAFVILEDGTDSDMPRGIGVPLKLAVFQASQTACGANPQAAIASTQQVLKSTGWKLQTRWGVRNKADSVKAH